MTGGQIINDLVLGYLNAKRAKYLQVTISPKNIAIAICLVIFTYIVYMAIYYPLAWN